MSFKEITAKEIDRNLIEMIADEWALVCVGDEKKYNMMTASWGFFGEMWGKDCVISAVRPQRYTYEFMENGEYFALCFMGDNKAVHKVCGSKSGRDVNKTELTGLTPVFSEKAVYFEEAETVIICKKAYAEPLKAKNFFDKEALDKWYNNDLHKMYIGEILKVLVKE